MTPAEPGLEYTVAVPFPEFGPYYQQAWAQSDLPVESYYNPRTAPYPAYNQFIPRRSGAFIQPGQRDAFAYELMNQPNPLDGLGAEATDRKQVKFAIGTWAVLALLKAAVASFVPKRKVQRFVRRIGPTSWVVLGVVTAGALTAWYLARQDKAQELAASLPEVDVSLFGQWAPEDPTGGAYTAEDEVLGPDLGPGENIAVGSVWAGSLKPRGFATVAMA